MNILLDDILNCYDELFANGFALPVFITLAVGVVLIIVVSTIKRGIK